METIETAKTLKLKETQPDGSITSYYLKYFGSEVEHYIRSEMKKTGENWFLASVGARYPENEHVLARFAEGTEYNHDSIRKDRLGDTRDKFAAKQPHEFGEDPLFAELEDTIQILRTFYNGELKKPAGSSQGFRVKDKKKCESYIPLDGGYKQASSGDIFVMKGILQIPRAIYLLDLFTAGRWNILLRIASDEEIKRILRFLSLSDKETEKNNAPILVDDHIMIEKARALGKIR